MNDDKLKLGNELSGKIAATQKLLKEWEKAEKFRGHFSIAAEYASSNFNYVSIDLSPKHVPFMVIKAIACEGLRIELGALQKEFESL